VTRSPPPGRDHGPAANRGTLSLLQHLHPRCLLHNRGPATSRPGNPAPCGCVFGCSTHPIRGWRAVSSQSVLRLRVHAVPCFIWLLHMLAPVSRPSSPWSVLLVLALGVQKNVMDILGSVPPWWIVPCIPYVRHRAGTQNPHTGSLCLSDLEGAADQPLILHV